MSLRPWRSCDDGSMTGASVLDDLQARGLVQDCTDPEGLAARLAEGPISLYYGCDPTADSLHVGNLLGLLVLRRFQDAGHRPVALAGGATGMVGDPSGQSDERNLLDAETLDANVAAIKTQMARILDFEAGGAVLVDNRDWTADVTLLDFLRNIGKHVTVNQMLARESVRARLAGEQGISYTEFSYMLLQAHDYLWLNEHLGVELQIGGSDQWGNIVSGIDLILGGHTHDAVPEPVAVENSGGKTLVSNAGSNGKFLAVVDLDLAPGSLRGIRYRLLPVFADLLKPDAEMEALIASLEAPHAAAFGRRVATAEGLLYRRGNFTGTMDHLLCDALRGQLDYQAVSNLSRLIGTQIPATIEEVRENLRRVKSAAH